MSCPHPQYVGFTDPPDQTAAPSTPRHHILSQFAEVMLADMLQIKDPMLLMRLRRDITDLVFKAAEEDMQRQCVQLLHAPVPGESAQSCSRPQHIHSPTNVSWRQRVMRRKNRGCEPGSRTQRWEEVKCVSRMSRSQLLQSAPRSQALDGMTENRSQSIIQAAEIKRETELHPIKMEEDVSPVM